MLTAPQQEVFRRELPIIQVDLERSKVLNDDDALFWLVVSFFEPCDEQEATIIMLHPPRHHRRHPLGIPGNRC
jgi:hypothetical protein